jgi:hypothetical protein
LENLTTDEINALIVEAGYSIVVDDSTFVQINASDEAQYEVHYNIGDEVIENHVFITTDQDGDLIADCASFD